MSSKGPLIGGDNTLGNFLNPTRYLTQKVTPDSWDKYTNVLTEAPTDFGGAFRDAAKAVAPNPGDPPALGEQPNPENSAKQLSAAEAAQRRAQGRASTILTSGSGTSGSAPTAKQTLLGV